MFINTQQPENGAYSSPSPKRDWSVDLNAELLQTLPGKHEVRLYELAKTYHLDGETPFMPLREFRDFMGIQPGQYTQFSKLRERVIDEPIKRINENELTDILISSQFKKKDGKVVAVGFIVETRYTMTLRQHKLWMLLSNAYRDACLRNGKPLADGEPCYLSIELVAAFLGREVDVEEIAEDLGALSEFPIVRRGLNRTATHALTSWLITPSNSIEFRLPAVMRQALGNTEERTEVTLDKKAFFAQLAAERGARSGGSDEPGTLQSIGFDRAPG